MLIKLQQLVLVQRIETTELITWTNALQNRCYMCIQWTRVLHSVVITRQSNPPISQFNSPCNEFTSFWSIFEYHVYTTYPCL